MIEEEKDDRLLFELKGRKLSGRYALIKTKFKGKDSWLVKMVKKQVHGDESGAIPSQPRIYIYTGRIGNLSVSLIGN